MKKTLLLTLALLLSVATFAQKRGTLLKETFDSPTMPEGWTITGGNNQNWSVSESKLCGGEAYEMMLNWTPVFYNALTRLTSPAIDLSGINEIMVSFKHYVDIYTTYPSTIGIATSSTGGSNWSVCYEQTFTKDGQHNINQIISNEDMGKENVLICVFYKGNSANINAVYFDDIEVVTIENINAKISSIDNPVNIGSGDTDITFTVQNLGTESITSFDAKYNVNGKTYSQTFETNIANLEMKQFVFEEAVSLTPGKYNIEVEITSVNNEEDQDMSNNALEKEINVALGSTQRIPLIEHFSSSTCGPCVSVNNSMHTLTNNNPGKYTYVKYPLGFPLPGDAYNTDEGNVRKNYYYVSAVPNVVFNGSNIGSSPISQYQLDNSYNDKSFVNIKGAFDVDGNNINITTDVMSYINLSNVKVFVTVNEKTTTGNTGTNGETEFHHIMMKMLNDAYGNATDINFGEYQRLEFSYDMSGTHVEEMNDLEVAVWVQDYMTGEVFNSGYLYEYTEHPYPARNLDFTEENGTYNITWEAPEKGEPTGYDLYINNELVLSNTTELSYSSDNDNLFCIEVVALYEGKTSVGIVKTDADVEQDCSAPTNLSALVEEDVPGYNYKFRVTMSWDAVESAVAYDVYVNGERYETTNTNSFTAPAAAEGVIEFSVMTICQNGQSELSEPYTITIESSGEGCLAPTNFSNTIEKDLPGYDKKYKITINWEAVEGAEFYSVYFHNKDYSGMWLGDVSTNSFEQGFNVDESTVYAFYVTIVTHCVGGTVSLESEPHQVVINGDLPDAPTGLTTQIEQNVEGYEYNFRVTLSWEALVNADEYYIYLDGKYLESTTETSYVMGFNEVGEHYFTVKTISEGIESEHSERVYFNLENVSIAELNSTFNIYPNPTKDKLFIESEENIEEITVYTITGVSVINVECRMNNVELDIENLNEGVYFVKIRTNNDEVVKRILKF